MKRICHRFRLNMSCVKIVKSNAIVTNVNVSNANLGSDVTGCT